MEQQLEERLLETKTVPPKKHREPYDPLELKERVQYNKKVRFQKNYW